MHHSQSGTVSLSLIIVGLILAISTVATGITLNQMDQSQDVRSQASTTCVGKLESDCENTNGCNWTATTAPCAELSETACGEDSDCTKEHEDCEPQNIYTSCSVFTKESTCKPTGCTWNSTAFCIGPSGCSDKSSKDTCTSLGYCSWTSSQSCKGMYRSSQTCPDRERYTGCSGTRITGGSCSGTPTAYCRTDTEDQCGLNGQTCEPDMNGGHCSTNPLPTPTPTPIPPADDECNPADGQYTCTSFHQCSECVDGKYDPVEKTKCPAGSICNAERDCADGIKHGQYRCANTTDCYRCDDSKLIKEDDVSKCPENSMCYKPAIPENPLQALTPPDPNYCSEVGLTKCKANGSNSLQQCGPDHLWRDYTSCPDGCDPTKNQCLPKKPCQSPGGCIPSSINCYQYGDGACQPNQTCCLAPNKIPSTQQSTSSTRPLGKNMPPSSTPTGKVEIPSTKLNTYSDADQIAEINEQVADIVIQCRKDKSTSFGQALKKCFCSSVSNGCDNNPIANGIGDNLVMSTQSTTNINQPSNLECVEYVCAINGSISQNTPCGSGKTAKQVWENEGMTKISVNEDFKFKKGDFVFFAGDPGHIAICVEPISEDGDTCRIIESNFTVTDENGSVTCASGNGCINDSRVVTSASIIGVKRP